VIAVPTTAGTGSEVTLGAVLDNPETHMKAALLSPYVYPRLALVDPELTCTMPPNVTAMGKVCAQEAMRVIYHALPAAIQRGDDPDLRSQMAWGDTLAGISLATNAIITPHSFSMILGGRYGITHGCATASVMAACLEHSRPGAVGTLAHVARLLGCDRPGSDDDLANWTIDAIECFIASMDLGRSVVE
jgi:alcohol dehydrogenase class IV